MQENFPPPKPKVSSQGNGSDNKQFDANDTHQVATYVANSTVQNEILTVRPSVSSFVEIPLSTPFEENDKEMPKARRSQSVGQFPSTPNKHKVSNGNSKSCPQASISRPLLKIWLESHQKEERIVVS